MAIDALARGMAAAAGGGGGGLDVGIDAGTGIRFTGTDPITIINTGVTAVTTPGDNDIAEDGTIKVANPGAENSADRVHYVKVKGINNAAFKDVDTVINDTKATSTNVPTTKAVYDELEKKLEADLDTTAFTNDNDHVPSSKLVKEKLDDKLEDSLTINDVSYNSNTDSYTLDGDDIDLTGYTAISSGTEEDVAATDSVNDGIAKIEYKADNRIPTANIDTDFPVTPDATHVLASTVASAEFKGTGTAGVNPKKGLVPAPGTISGTETRFLKADGTWATPPNTEYSEGTGIDINNAGVISNTGVTDVSPSDIADPSIANGTFKVVQNGTEKYIPIKGLDDAAYKDVDNAITSGSTSINLPTTQAVADYVDDAISDIDATDINLTSNYAPASTASLPAASDPVQTAIGKLAKSVDANQNSISLLGADISFTINSSTYELTARLLNSEGDAIGTGETVDLPLESMVVDADYDDTNKTIVLTLKNGQTTSFSVADLVSGLQTELSSDNKLNPAFIDYDASHRAVSDTEKGTWNGKQDVISDLATIRSGAAAGATAVQPSALETALAEKQNALTTTQMNAVNSGITAAGVEQIGKNASNVAYAINTGVKNLAVLDVEATSFPSGTSIVVNNDGSISLNITSTTQNNFAVKISKSISVKQGSTYVLSGCPSAGPVRLVFRKNGDQWTEQQYAGHAVTWTADADYDNSDLILYIYANTGSVSLNIRPMFALQSVYDADSSFVAGALSNAILTPAVVDAVDTGAKNYLSDRHVGSNTFNGVTFIHNSDDSITINGTSTGTFEYELYINSAGTTMFNNKVVSGSIASSGTDAAISIIVRSNSNTEIGRSSGGNPFVIPIGSNVGAILLRFNTGETVTNKTIYPMICTIADWNVSQKFVSYALSNPVLTPALIEQVDNGSKNKFLCYNSFTQGGISMTASNGVASITWSAIGSANAYCRLGADLYLEPGTYVLSGMLNSNVNHYIHFEKNGSTINNLETTNAFTFTVTSSSDKYVMYLGVKANSPAQSTAVTVKPMVCTVEDWNVSQNFAPYAKSNYELTKEVSRGNALYGNLTAEQINNLQFGTYQGYINGSNIIPGISNDYVVIQTLPVTTTGGTKIQVLSSTKGARLLREYINNAWTDWLGDFVYWKTFMPASANVYDLIQSITIPANHGIDISASLFFANSVPRGIIITTASTADQIAAINTYAKVEQSTTELVTLTAHTLYTNANSTARTLYIYGKQENSSANNQVTVRYNLFRA